MTELAVALSLLAAGLHAAWNLRLKSAEDPLQLAARAVPYATVAAAPPVGIAWLLSGRPGLPWQGWMLVAVSTALELAYFHLLSAAYRRGDVSSVYPTARGTAVLLAVVIGLAVLHERLALLQILGVLMLMAGIWLVRPPRGQRASLGLALLTGVCIAGYSAIDRIGVRLGPFWLYAWLLFAAISLGLAPWRGRERTPAAPLVGLLTVGSYALVLAALTFAPLALVAPLRESGVVLVSVWGVLRLRERERAPLKLSGAAAVLAGAALLATG